MDTQRILELQAAAAPLEPSAERRQAISQRIMNEAEAYMQALPNLLAFQGTEEQGIGVLESGLSEDPIDLDEVVRVMNEHVVFPGANINHPGYMAFIPASGLYLSSLGDYMAAVTNRYAGVFFAAPGAVRMERMLTDWMADFIGFPKTALGDFTPGGSVANMHALLTAREGCGLKSEDFAKSVVYYSTQTHHCSERGLNTIGLRDAPRRHVAINDQFHMVPDSLRELIAKDKEAGLKPWILIATAGTTSTGAIDPLHELADIAEEHGLWFHVDGAYGGAFALCDSGKKRLSGIERADSVVLDPHKSLFLPLGTGIVLVKDGKKLIQANSYEGGFEYLQDLENLIESGQVSPSQLGVELSRPFRGLRLWLPLKLGGVGAFKAALEEKLALAEYFYEEIGKREGFTAGPKPDLSVVTFRYEPSSGDANEFNAELVARIQREGRIFISSTTVDGVYLIRLAILGFRTHLDTVNLALEILETEARKLEEERG